MEKGYIQIYYGNGKGKTTAAIGQAVRAAGRGLKVHFVQFLKSQDSGERISLKELKNITLADAPASLPFYFMMDQKEKQQYNKYAIDLFSKAVSSAKDFDVLILDEILDIVNLDILSDQQLLEFLNSKPNGLEVVLTGRSISVEVRNAAHYISRIVAEKHPFDEGVLARQGIEY